MAFRQFWFENENLHLGILGKTASRPKFYDIIALTGLCGLQLRVMRALTGMMLSKPPTCQTEIPFHDRETLRKGIPRAWERSWAFLERMPQVLPRPWDAPGEHSTAVERPRALLASQFRSRCTGLGSYQGSISA